MTPKTPNIYRNALEQILKLFYILPERHEEKCLTVKQLIFEQAFEVIREKYKPEDAELHRNELRELGKHLSKMLAFMGIEDLIGTKSYKNPNSPEPYHPLNVSIAQEKLDHLARLVHIFAPYLPPLEETLASEKRLLDAIVTLYRGIEEKNLNQETLSYLLQDDVDLNQPVFYNLKDGTYLRSDDNALLKPLFFACATEAPLSLIQLLLEQGADVNATEWMHEDPEYNRTLILSACQHSNDINLLELLIKYGADVNDFYHLSCGETHTALLIACIFDKPPAFIKCLLDHGANPNHQALAHQKPLLSYALGYADHDYNIRTHFKYGIENIALLIMAGASTDKITLQIPLEAEAPEYVIAFLLEECDIRATPEDVYTFCAYAKPSEHLMNLFLAHGAHRIDMEKVNSLIKILNIKTERRTCRRNI